MRRDTELARECREAYEALAPFRARRRRLKRFAWGRQWDDPLRLPSGRVLTEEQMIAESGRTPITNNLIGRLLKSVEGRYRYYAAAGVAADGDGGAVMAAALDGAGCGEADVASLQEFMISGLAVQRAAGGERRNVSPGRVFFRRFGRHDGSDCRLIGMLHDVSAGELVAEFGVTSPRLLARIMSTGRAASVQEPLGEASGEYGVSDTWGAARLVEVYVRECRRVEMVYDPERPGELRHRVAGAGGGVAGGVKVRRGVADCWVRTWMTPDGDVLRRDVLPPGACVPLVVEAYPMADGEVHSLVEDVVSQQKTVNRLMMMLDEVMTASAKGVVLYPVDQLPDGLTWSELRRMWSSPQGILPFKRTSRNIMPRQVSASASCAGAAELLQTQLRLFDDIGGVALRDSAGASAGADAMRQRRDESTVAILGLMARFRSFVARASRVAGGEEERRGDRESRKSMQWL